MNDPDQNPVTTKYTNPVLYESCYSGQYRNKYANDFVSYVLKNYAVDGIWHNAPGSNGICYCPYCKSSYKAASGKDIPLVKSASEEDIDRYMDWKVKVADEY